MPDYLITWETEHWAVDPHEAAQKAWQDRSAPGSLANTFTVTDQATGSSTEVTLSDDAPDWLPWAAHAQRFRASFDITVIVDAPTIEIARQLLANVDFDVRLIGGPVRLGLVWTLENRAAIQPVALVLRPGQGTRRR